MRRHSLDAVSLVFGVIFVGLGTLYLTGFDVDELVFRFWPAALVVLGLAMLLTGRREDREALVPPVPPAPPVSRAPVSPTAPVSAAPVSAASPVSPSPAAPVPPVSRTSVPPATPAAPPSAAAGDPPATDDPGALPAPKPPADTPS